jgi:phage-related protein
VREKEEKMAIITAPNEDYVGFSYGKWHCIRDGLIYRTSDGSRYSTDLIPALKDQTADIPGGDGQFFFGSFHKSRSFTINFAFDSLTEELLRALRRKFNGKDIQELIFDERPYVAYDAKVTGTPTIKTICFDDENGQRVYKGEGTVQFTCYNPYGHTPTWVWTDCNGNTANADGRLLSSYNEIVYTSKN